MICRPCAGIGFLTKPVLAWFILFSFGGVGHFACKNLPFLGLTYPIVSLAGFYD
jgi:hypothetical protein